MKIASYTNEIKLRQNLRRVTLISLSSFVILIIFGLAIFKIVSYVFTSTQQDELQATISEYAISIKRKAQSDMLALQSIAMFTKAPEDITASYTNKGINFVGSSFEIIGYWEFNGNCHQVSLHGLPTDTHYNNLPSEVKIAINSAWQGKAAVSAPYYSKTIGHNMFTYATPIFDADGEVIAALSGAVFQDTYADILNQLATENQGIDSFLTTSTGFLFALGINSAIPSNLKNITDLNISEEAQNNLRLGLLASSTNSFNIQYNDQKYQLTLTPLGFSDWFLGTINNIEIGKSQYFNSMLILVIVLILIFCICAFVAIYLFLNMKSSFKTQLLIAHYDPVTDAYNYSKFLLEFERLNYQNNATPIYAMATLNIHDFSYTCDILGELQINELLRTIAHVLKEHNDIVIFCHHEADQFYMLLNLKDPDQITKTLHSIMETCVADINSNISSIPIVMYSGVAFTYPDLPPEKIVARAEFAQKQVKKSYNHIVRFYDENAYKKEAFLHAIEKSMRTALVNEEFKLFLQPKIDLATGKIYAAEALVRWISDSQSVVYPNDFIPLFEKNGFCTELDLFMFEKVCKKIRYYLDHNIEPIYFSINQTKLLIFQKGYSQKLLQLLTKYNIPPKYIVIEVLEDLATNNVDDLNRHINELKNLGLSIALDDFGSGYSSLNIVAGLDIDEIKFDREFLMAKDEQKLAKNQMILKVISHMAKELGIRTVVEGVERASDVEFLKSIDCDLAQGYFYDRPIPADTFDRKYMFPNGIPPEENAQDRAAKQAAASKQAAQNHEGTDVNQKENKAAIAAWINNHKS